LFWPLNVITAQNTIHEADIRNLKRKDHLGELGVDWRTTIKWNLKEQDVRITVGLVRLKTQSGGAFLRPRKLTFGFYKTQGSLDSLSRITAPRRWKFHLYLLSIYKAFNKLAHSIAYQGVLKH
jgi:hypothetical protein